MSENETISAGNWPSWVGAELVADRSRGFSELRTAGGWIFWLETRSEEEGRPRVMARAPDGTVAPLSPEGFEVGTRVNEYGGGAWDARLGPEGPELAFSDRRTGAVWIGARAVASGEEAGRRYADLTWDSTGGAAGAGVFCVRETLEGGEARSAIVHLSRTGVETVLAEGADFHAAPRPSPDGAFLAWFAWNDPEMPWTATRLFVAPYDAASCSLGPAEALDDGRRQSIIEPRWSPDGALYAASDANGRWTPLCFTRSETGWKAEFLPDCGAEIGLPHWVFGQRTLLPLGDGELLALGIRNGKNEVLAFSDGVWRKVALGSPLNVPEPLPGGRFAWIDAPEDTPASLATGTPGGPVDRFRQSVALPEGVTAADISLPVPLSFPTEGGETAHALFYPPASSRHSLAEGEKPPLVVMAHGGPTGRANPAFSLKVQWWTSRGFAVLDVNYRGSTGFGRAYRESLDGRWGLADVEDCIAGARAVIARGLANPARCVIRGSSAGGLTVLSALARSSLFAAGASLYGVTDLRALAEETHRFEARYLDGLIGRYPAEEAVYLERSPVTFAGDIAAPVLFLHGGRDRVVPLSQAEAMIGHLREARLHVYPEEGHGFRANGAVQDALLRELAFYREVFARG